MPALYHFVNYEEQSNQPYTKTVVQKIPGIISILPLEQNIDKTAIPGTIFMGSRDGGLLSGELRIHDGITLGGISIPPPGTVFHMLTKKGNNQKDHLAGAINLGESYLASFLTSSIDFPKELKANTVLIEAVGNYMEHEWSWVSNTANLVITKSDGTTTYDGTSSLYPPYSGFLFEMTELVDTTDLTPIVNQHSLLTHRPLAVAHSKNVSCRYELEFTARALGFSQYDTLITPYSRVKEQVGVLIAQSFDENGKEHNLTALVTPNANSLDNWNPFEIIYNYGKDDATRIYHIPDIQWQGFGHTTTSQPHVGTYFEFGYKFKIKRDKGLFNIIINRPGTDDMSNFSELQISLDLWNNPTFPWLKTLFPRDSGTYGFVANNRDWLFSDIKFIDYEKDFETPEGYMFADGAILDKRIYGALYSKIGDIWNTKSNLKSYEFQIPDLRGHFIRCYKNEYISGKLGARTRKEDTIRKHGHYTLVDDAGGHMHQYFELGINSSLDKPPITPEGTVLNEAHAILQAPGPDAWRGVWAVYANIQKNNPAAEDYFGRIDDVNIGVERIQGSSVPNQNQVRHGNEAKFWNVPWKYKQYESKFDGGDIMEHGVDGEQYDDLSPKPDAVMLGEGTTFPLDIPQLHKHELELDVSQKYPGDASTGSANRPGWMALGPDLPDGEGVPINIKIQTFIKF